MALRYGTVLIVRETGGLKDTVEPHNEYGSRGTGFSFSNYNAHEMLDTVRYAKYIYYDKKRVNEQDHRPARQRISPGSSQQPSIRNSTTG